MGPLDIVLPLAEAALLAVLSFRVMARRRIRILAEWMRRARTADAPPPPAGTLFEPLARETAALARELALARAAAEQEARLRDLADPLWTAERLREHVRARLSGRPLLIVANREPYRHVRRGRQIEVETPASGLVTGLEPLLRACGGTWVAHGDGDADRETSDARGRLKVPPDAPQYALRRVWLSAEEERGYYSGFSNEGLWPLCHIAHVRPVFRASDWRRYQDVNARFAQAVFDEIRGQDEPYILLQDYHFTLLPKLLKERRPDARVALFWHIPWPNPEAFGICPWQKELLEGLLGADLIGFHTQFHCNNFLDTVDRVLESHIDWERFAVTRGSHAAAVKALPVSVAFPAFVPKDAGVEARAARERVLASAGLKADFVGVGVDRLDYTKGIIERFRGIERLMETQPRYRGRFVFFQIGAPSRTSLGSYRDFVKDVEVEAARVNARFAGVGAPPIVMLTRYHTHAALRPYLLAADVCLVTSLHDGMNLVAKEFVAAREDKGGVLILSRFTGAAHELSDALIVNPYDAGEIASATHEALTMPAAARAARMSRLRRQVREHNVYRWAAELISELSSVRLPAGL